MDELDRLRERLDSFIESDLDLTSIHSPQLVEAMRYSVLGGKRLRGCLVCAAATALGANLDLVLSPAAAVEYLHAYSLIHDDLPDMDDSDLRRGKPSCHAKFGPGMAILAGDALQSLAFSTIADAEGLSSEERSACVSILANAAGWQHMVGGQAMDLALENVVDVDEEQIQTLHRAKTGALFRACAEIGSIVAGYDQESEEFELLGQFALRIGTSFQIVDDLLDVTQTTEQTGKPTGLDVVGGKRTYVSVLGKTASKTRAQNLLQEASNLLERLPLESSTLLDIADRCVKRIN